MNSRRRQFLDQFLGALGADQIISYMETADEARGTIVYRQSNQLLTNAFENETQDFVWKVSEQDVPGESTLNIAKLLNEHNLLSIDKIIISREELHEKSLASGSPKLSFEQFCIALDSLESVEVTMVDDDSDSGDYFFIHE